MVGSSGYLDRKPLHNGIFLYEGYYPLGLLFTPLACGATYLQPSYVLVINAYCKQVYLPIMPKGLL